MHLHIEFRPWDCWVGVRWKRELSWIDLPRLHVWVCLVPCFPLHLRFP